MTAPIDLVTDADIAEALRLDREATRGPWRWWTSNSHRRLRAAGAVTRDVAFGTKQRDGVDDIVISEEDMALIECYRTLLPRLAAHLAALRAGARAVVARLEGAVDEQSALARANREEPDEWVHGAAGAAYAKAAEMVAALCGDGPTDLVLVPAAELERLRAVDEAAGGVLASRGQSRWETVSAIKALDKAREVSP